MEIVVFGAGSLGSLVGGLLAEVHDVTLVGRDPHVAAVAESGLRVEGALQRTVHPTAVTALAPGTAADLGVVTVKAYDTEAAAAALSAADLGGVLSLQNGLGNEATLAEALDVPVLAGTTTYGALLEAPGVVACTGVGDVTVGPWDGEDAAALADRVGDAFEAAGLETGVVEDVRPRLWEKLAVNAGINPVTALARVENGALREGPAREVAGAAAAEVARVARSAGVDLGDDAAREALQRVAEATAENRSSMRRDVERGRRTEVDAINGYVVDRATEPVPVNRTLAALVRAHEAGRSGR